MLKVFVVNKGEVIFLTLFILFSFFFLQELNAQQRFKGGIVAGVNLSQIDGDDLAGYNQPGINAGGMVAAILSDKVQLTMELLFSQKGSHRSKHDSQSAALDNMRLNYVEAPFLISYFDWRFRFYAGFSYARLFSYKLKDYNGEDVTDTYDFRSNVFSFFGGATYEINDNVGIDIRWGRATNIQADSGATKFRGKTLAIRGIYLF